MSVNTKMTAIADEIRELSGTTAAMGLDAMAAHVSDANAEVDEQAIMIEELLGALDGKSAPEGSTLSTVYVGTTDPTVDIGSDGDIYIKRSGA